MQDSGSTQSGTSLRITTPIANLPTNTSNHHSEAKSPEISDKVLPTPDTLEAYRAIKQQPYAFEHFQTADLKDLPTYGKWAEIVDSYVQSEMQSKSYKDSIATYKEIINSISLNLGLDEKVEGAVRLRKIAQWLRDVVIPMRNIEKRKLRILHANT